MTNKINIGLVAPFDEPNYGTVLQAYALQKSLSDRGVDSEYIRFINDERPACVQSISQLIKTFIQRMKFLLGLRKDNLEDFSFFKSKEFTPVVKGYSDFVKNNIKCSDVVFNRISLRKTSRYLSCIVGSDQTWSEFRCRNNDLYFLGCVNEDVRKYSYAPSLGTTTISSAYAAILEEGLRGFRMLSCREKANAEYLSSLIGCEVKHVVDPTLLLSPSEWNNISDSTLCPTKPYLLAYILGEKECISQYAEMVGQELGLQVYYIVTRPLYSQKINTLYPTPGQFVALISHASFVVTDSFHGTIFSVNHSVDFAAFSKREGDLSSVDNARIIEILSLLGLENHFLEDNSCTKTPKIDYPAVHNKLSLLQKMSIEYLELLIQDLRNESDN